MFKCQCGSCQQVIAWKDSKSLITEEQIVCPSCKTSLALNRQARSFAFILGAVFIGMLIYLSRNWISGAASPMIVIMCVFLSFAAGEPIAKAISYAISSLFCLNFKNSLGGDNKVAYLRLARQGRNDGWRYLLGLFLIFVISTGIGIMPIQALAGFVDTDNDPFTKFIPDTMIFKGIDPSIIFLVLMVQFIPLLGGTFIAVRFIHKRPFRSLITGAGQVNWKRVFQGAGIYLTIILGFGVIDLILSPEDYQFTFDANRFLRFLPFALVLTPIQAMTEEILSRGYIMQGLGLLMDKWGAVTLSALLFALPHLANPEVQSAPMIAMISLFILGVFLALITLKEGSLELAMGVHTINNITSFLFIAPAEGFAGIPLPTIFSSKAAAYSEATIWGQLIVFALFWMVTFKWFPRLQPALTNQGQV